MYYYIVQSYRDKKTGKVKQKVVKYLGNTEKLKSIIQHNKYYKTKRRP